MFDVALQWEKQGEMLLDPPTDMKPYAAFAYDEMLGSYNTEDDAHWACWEEAERVLGEYAPHKQLCAWVEENTRVCDYTDE